MTVSGFFGRILLVATAFALPSCIDGREEVWLEADGSGRSEISYTIPSSIATMQGGEEGLRKMISGFLKETPEIRTSDCEISTEDDRTKIRIRAAFDSALDLKEVAQGPSLSKLPSSASHLAGVVDVKIRGRTLDFSRSISPAKALPGSSFLPASQFEGHRLVYIMHLPAVTSGNNATRVENGGRTLIWDMPLLDALKTPIVTRFQMEIPIPWKIVSGVAIPLSLAAGFIIFRFRRSKSAVAG
jgi:hypothetical protein